MKKKNEIIVNAFYVHNEVIEEPSCVEETFYEVNEDEDLDNFLRFLMILLTPSFLDKVFLPLLILCFHTKVPLIVRKSLLYLISLQYCNVDLQACLQ